MTATLVSLGLGAAAVMLAALVWSRNAPDRRLWPPRRSGAASAIVVWGLTGLVFGASLSLGLMHWNALGLPAGVRWGLGAPLVVGANFVVWREVLGLGLRGTSGAATGLRTEGLYRRSRNPQYTADIVLLIGWGLLCAAPAAILVAAGGIAVLLCAPLAEEPWLEAQYGAAYRRYRARTPRFL